MQGHVESRYSKQADGKMKFTSGGNVLTGAGTTKTGESSKVWRGFDPKKKNRHWAIPGFYEELMPRNYKKLGTLEKLEALYEAGLIEIDGKSQWPIMVRYLDERDGVPLQDIWAYQPYTQGTVWDTNGGIDEDVAWFGTTAPERLGYQTQKPIGLLERIIKSSTDEGDIVLDPFCGCGTTVHAAQKWKRQWIGIDITHLAIALIETRLRDAFPGIIIEVHGTPKDLEGAMDLAKRDKYEFQYWACPLVKAQPYQGKKKGADSGIDGLIFFQDEKGPAKKIIVSVKGGENVGVSMIRDLIGVVDRDKAQIGMFVTLAPPTQPMKKEAVKAGYYESTIIKQSFPKIQILTIGGLLNGTERAQYPSEASFGGHTFKKTKKEESSEQKKLF